MAGKVNALIQQLYQLRGAAPSAQHFVKAHLVLSGIDPDDYDEYSRDDAQKIAQLEKMIADYRAAPTTTARSRQQGGSV